MVTEFSDACSMSTGAIGIVGSAGGIEAVLQLLDALDPQFGIPIIVAQHLSRRSPSILPSILNWRARCPAKWAEDGEEVGDGRTYVVPPACAATVRDGRFRISPLPDTARSWLTVPDLLLNSLSEAYGSQAIAVVLSGMLPVGVTGLRAIRTLGGVTMAQSELTSAHFEMPVAAIDLGKADIVFSPRGIGRALNILAAQRRPDA